MVEIVTGIKARVGHVLLHPLLGLSYELLSADLAHALWFLRRGFGGLANGIAIFVSGEGPGPLTQFIAGPGLLVNDPAVLATDPPYGCFVNLNAVLEFQEFAHIFGVGIREPLPKVSETIDMLLPDLGWAADGLVLGWGGHVDFAGLLVDFAHGADLAERKMVEVAYFGDGLVALEGGFDGGTDVFGEFERYRHRHGWQRYP